MAPMAGSRTIKTLATLIASLAVGTFVLVLMETPPARPPVPLSLQADRHRPGQAEMDAVCLVDDGVNIQYIKWRNIIVHDSSQLGPEIVNRCHFLIGRGDSLRDGAIQPCMLWRQQVEGDHIRVPGFSYNSNSIGVCLLGNARAEPHTQAQMTSLVNLIRALQITCQIPRDHVYLHSELSEADCPGGRLSAKALRDRLIPSARGSL